MPSDATAADAEARDGKSGEDAAEPVVSRLEAIHQLGYSRARVMRDWVELMLLALQGRDDPYLAVVERYVDDHGRPPLDGDRTHPVRHYAAAFGELQVATADTDGDGLGAVYETFGHPSDALGQHFTPTPVCEAMTAMLLTVESDDEDEDEDADADAAEQEADASSDDGGLADRELIGDPACGSGRMLLAMGRKKPDAFYVGQDKDLLCAKMAALNLCFFNLDGYAVHGDSLKVEGQQAWRARHTPLGGEVAEVDPAIVPTVAGTPDGDEQ
jgi:hypothetical protein